MRGIHFANLAVGVTAVMGIFSISQAQEPPASVSDPQGVYFVAFRTPGHVKYSSADVFHQVSDDVLGFLRSNGVNIVEDPERKVIETSEQFSTESLLNLAKQAGASHLFYLTVDRPKSGWIKLTAQCYDLSGKLLWEETAGGSALMTLSSKKEVRKDVDKLKKQIAPRIGELGLVFISGVLSGYEDVSQQPASTESSRQAQQPAPRKVLLPEGTEVNLKTAQKLTSETSFVGEPVELVLAEDLKVGDAVVVMRGTRVLGTVVGGKESEKKRAPARELTIRVDYIRSGDVKIALRGGAEAEGKRSRKAMAAGGAVLGVSGILLMSRKSYVLPEGSPLKAYVDESIEVPVLGGAPSPEH